MSFIVDLPFTPTPSVSGKEVGGEVVRNDYILIFFFNISFLYSLVYKFKCSILSEEERSDDELSTTPNRGVYCSYMGYSYIWGLLHTYIYLRGGVLRTLHNYPVIKAAPFFAKNRSSA